MIFISLWAIYYVYSTINTSSELLNYVFVVLYQEYFAIVITKLYKLTINGILWYNYKLTINTNAPPWHIGFWIRESTFREQPDIRFKHDIIMILQGETPDSQLVWSTYRNLNLLQDNKLRVPMVQVRNLLYYL